MKQLEYRDRFFSGILKTSLIFVQKDQGSLRAESGLDRLLYIVVSPDATVT
jgi:hypothetical protein